MSEATFTDTMIAYVINDPGAPEAVLSWVAGEPDPQRRIDRFAASLAESFTASLLAEEDPGRPECALRNAHVRAALAMVDWHQVARVLLDAFPLPLIAASCATDRQGLARFTRSPATWRGPVN